MRWTVLGCATVLLVACGDDAPGPANPAATLTPMAVQVAPPAPVQPVPAATLTAATTPVPAVPSATRDARIEAWLTTPLRGHDNNMARMRGARIRRSDADSTAFVVTIANQFRWTCRLEFGPEGSPSLLRGCRSGESGWFAEPDEIPLTCEERAADELCAGRYTLGARGGMRMPARFQIIRPL